MSFCCAPFDTAMIAVQADVRSVICAWNASLDFAERNRTHRCPLEVVEKGPGMKGTNPTSIGDRASQSASTSPYYWGATPVGYAATITEHRLIHHVARRTVRQTELKIKTIDQIK